MKIKRLDIFLFLCVLVVVALWIRGFWLTEYLSLPRHNAANRSAKKIVVFLAGALAIVWSVNSYHTRHRSEHRDRLQRLLASHPIETQLQEMFGHPTYPGAPAEAVTFVRETWRGPEFTITPDLMRRSTRAVIYQVGDMVYVIFLDSSGTMIDFVLSSTNLQSTWRPRENAFAQPAMVPNANQRTHANV